MFLVEDARNLLKWINLAEPQMLDDKCVLGDVHTVKSLLDKHKLFENDCSAQEKQYDIVLQKGE